MLQSLAPPEAPVLDLIPWDTIGFLTPSGLVLLAVLLMMRGDLVPRRTVEREQSQLVAAHAAERTVLIDSRNHWRDTATTLQETNAVQARTIDKQTTAVGATVVKVMDAVQQAREVGEPA